MKRKIIITVIMMFSFISLEAQWTSKKTAINIVNDYTTNGEHVFNITKGYKPEIPDYVIIQSEVEIPITYDAISYSDHKSGSEVFQNNAYSNNTKVASVGSKSETLFQSFAVFTIVNTNELEVANIQEDTSQIKEDLDKYLPDNFDAYKGMFSDKINAETMLNPITSF